MHPTSALRVPRRQVLRMGAAALGAGLLCDVVTAQTTGRVIVPYPPGAATDNLGRVMADLLGASGTKYIVENKGGGATQIGTKLVATATPDGNTLGFVDTAFVINPGLFGSALPYDTRKDFAPVSLMATAPLVLVVHAGSVPAKSIQEFVALAKSQPGKLSYGSAGAGSAPHLAGEQLRNAAGIAIVHVPYRGGSTVITDILAGHIQFGFTTVPTMLQHIRAGTVRALAVTSPSRSTQLPQVPTMREAGLARVDASPLFGLIAPAKTPQPVIDKLAAAAQSVRSGPVHERLIEMGFVPVGSTPEEFRGRIESEITKWSAVIRAGSIKPNE